MANHASMAARPRTPGNRPRAEMAATSAARSMDAPARQGAEPAERLVAMPGGPDAPRVLLIEDNPGDARLILELLRDVGSCDIELTHVERLSAGLAHLASAGADVVLLDLSLPDSTGLDTLLRTLDRAPAIPVVVLSGINDETIALQAVRSGARDYLAKGDLTGRGLVQSIRFAIERARMEREELRAIFTKPSQPPS